MNDKVQFKPGSAMLLTIMVVSVLTSLSLSGAAVRYDQLAITDRVNNSAVAKLAAESGVADLRERLDANQSFNATLAHDLNANIDISSQVDKVSNFRPTPRKSIYTIEPENVHLPRCLAVAVLSPWVNEGKYLFQDASTSSPASVFHVANIVNSTRLKSIPGNENLETEDAGQTIQSLTGTGHFFNPYAADWSNSVSPSYWTIRFGGPRDQLLTDKSVADNSKSLYQGLDMLYVPYLPRFVDSGLNTTSGLVRVNGDGGVGSLRDQFEKVITQNNMKVWLDANVSDELLYEHGLGDLFSENSQYRISWFQPSLINDLPEVEDWGPYRTDNINDNDGTVDWIKQTRPAFNPGLGSPDWEVDILRGTKPMAFFGLGNSSFNFTRGASLSLPLYGSMTGLRLNQKVNLLLTDQASRPLQGLEGRTEDPGTIYNATIKNIVTSGAQVSVTVTLSSDSYETPYLAGSNVPVNSSSLLAVGVIADVQHSTTKSFTNVTLGANKAVSPTVSGELSCPRDEGTGALVACPGIGDIVNFKKISDPNHVPVWGVVKTINYSPNGAQLIGFTVDDYRAYPKPIRDYASAAFEDDIGGGRSVKKVAIFGGRMATPTYDGGFASELDELWFYTPATNVWEYVNAGIDPQVIPGRRFGATLTYDNVNRRLIMFGGSAHAAVPGGCNDATQRLCLANNRIGYRLDQKYFNDIYFLETNFINTGANRWVKPSLTPGQKIENNVDYRVRVLSTIAERSGKEDWLWNAKVYIPAGGDLDLNVGVGASNTLSLTSGVAGFANGDEVLLLGQTTNNRPFRAWGRISATPNWFAQQLTINVYGYVGTSPVELEDLTIRLLNRTKTDVTCKGSVAGAGLFTDYGCTLQGGQSFESVSIGDLVALEKYNNINDPSSLQDTLVGYVSGVNNSQLKVIPSESLLGNFDYVGNTIFIGFSAIRQPEPRWGANAYLYQPPGVQTSPELVVWQGAQKDTTTRFRPASAWTMIAPNTNFGDLPATVTWQLRQLNFNNKPSTPALTGLQVTSYPTNPIMFTQDLAENTEIMPAQTGWSNSQEWTLEFDLSNPFSTGVERIALGSSVFMERQHSDSLESFHGVVQDIAVAGNRYRVKLKHDSAYPGDSGLLGDSKNAKMAMLYDDFSLGSGGGRTSGISLAKTTEEFLSGGHDLLAVPRGAIVTVMLGDSNSAKAYHGTVRERKMVYNRGTLQNVQLFFDDKRLLESPIPQPNVVGSFAERGASQVSALSYTTKQINIPGFGEYNQGPMEWALNNFKSPSAVTWEFRRSSKDTTNGINERPWPRQGAAVGYKGKIDNFGEKQTDLYVVGGTYGKWSGVWRESDTGKLDNDASSWKRLSSNTTSSASDIPNMFGGSLSLYDGDKAVFLGGRYRFDAYTEDRGTFFGARFPAVPEGASTSTDNVFSLADDGVSSPADGRRIANGIFDYLSSEGQAWTEQFRSSVKQVRGNLATENCAYIGEQNCNGQALRHLGRMGRISADSSLGQYEGYSSGFYNAVINPGSAFLKESSQKSLILSGPERLSTGATARTGVDAYYPYKNADSTKSIMLAGFTRLSGLGGSLLVTPAGVGQGVLYNPENARQGDAAYSYCSVYDAEGNCDTAPKNVGKYLTYLPDPEDLLFMLNASQSLSETDTYRVIGYYGGVRRGFLVNKRSGVYSLTEIVP